VFGESVLNDAVAIVLARTVLQFNQPEAQSGGLPVLLAVGIFVAIFFGSMAVGLVFGAASALTFKFMRFKHHRNRQVIESTVAMVFPWASYYSSEALGLSGIATILFCGIVMATYTRRNLSSAAAGFTRDLFEAVAKGAETFVFVYLGMAAFTYPIFSNTVWPLAAVTLVACLIGRLHVFATAYVTNYSRAHCHGSPTSVARPARVLTNKHSVCIWFSGLRGGVAFAIAAASYGDNDFRQNCGGWDDQAADAQLPQHCRGDLTDSLAILQATLLIAAFTILVFGSSARDVAVACRVMRTPESSHAPLVTSAQWERIDAWLCQWLTSCDGSPRLPSIEGGSNLHTVLPQAQPMELQPVVVQRKALHSNLLHEHEATTLSDASSWDSGIADDVPQRPEQQNGSAQTSDQ